MQLQPLGRLSTRYEESSFHRPFGGSEGFGYSVGTGEMTGDLLSGQLRWSNYPHRREDGVWTPDLRGYIQTGDGAEVLITMQGLAVLGDTPGTRRAVLARIELLASDERYSWLNTRFVVAEGEFDESLNGWWVDCHLCINTTVDYPPMTGRPRT